MVNARYRNLHCPGRLHYPGIGEPQPTGIGCKDPRLYSLLVISICRFIHEIGKLLIILSSSTKQRTPKKSIEESPTGALKIPTVQHVRLPVTVNFVDFTAFKIEIPGDSCNARGASEQVSQGN